MVSEAALLGFVPKPNNQRTAITMTDASVLEKENAFTQALPKLELHAHLTGSISRRCLHDIWEIRKRTDPSFELDDPLAAIPQGEGRINIVTYVTFCWAALFQRRYRYRSTGLA